MIDLEPLVERRELLDEPAPLVGAAHALHDEDGGRLLDDLLARDGPEVDLEIGLVPDEHPVDGLFAAERAHLGIDGATAFEPHVTELAAALERDRPALLRDLEGLQQVDDGHVLDRAGEARLERRGDAAVREALLRAAREHDVDAREQLTNEDRLGEVVLHAELEPADLVLDRALRREEDDGDRRPLAALAKAADERVAVHPGELRVGDDEVRRLLLDHLERGRSIGRACDVVTSLS